MKGEEREQLSARGRVDFSLGPKRFDEINKLLTINASTTITKKNSQNGGQRNRYDLGPSASLITTEDCTWQCTAKDWASCWNEHCFVHITEK